MNQATPPTGLSNRGPSRFEFFELINPPLPIPVLEDGSDWWAGVQQIGAILALAALSLVNSSTAVASSVVAQWQDEVPRISQEEYWQNQTAPVPPTFLAPPQWTFDEQSPILFPQPDEDFWRNSVAPVPLTFLWPQQWTFDEQIPAGFLTALDEEGVWVSWVAPQSWTPPIQAFNNDDVFAPSPFRSDEDFWTNSVAPLPLTFGPLYLPDSEQTAVLYGQYDEDFWQNPSVPIQTLTLGSLYLPDPEEIPAAQLTATVDEYYWQNPNVPLNISLVFLQQWPFDEQVPVLSAIFQPDEDFWTNPAAPSFPNNYVANPFLDPEEIPVGQLFGVYDEVFWQNQVAPQLSVNNIQPLTSDELVGQPIFFQPDEDFWQNSTPPYYPNNFIALPIFFDTSEVIHQAVGGTIRSWVDSAFPAIGHSRGDQ